MTEYTISIRKKGLQEAQVKNVVRKVEEFLKLEPGSLDAVKVPAPPTSRSDRLSAAASAAKEAVDDYKSEVEMLLEEMQSWLDNLEGANMESVPKHDEVQECIDALESLQSDIEDLEVPEGDDVMFPGMY